MTQPPPDRAPEEQVSESVLASIESMGYTVHVTGKLLREMVRDCREAARLRARGVADEAARKVADLDSEIEEFGWSHRFDGSCGCPRCRLAVARKAYRAALAGDEQRVPTPTPSEAKLLKLWQAAYANEHRMREAVAALLRAETERADKAEALAATRAGNETNQAGEEAIFEAPVRETAGHAGTSDAATPSSPATSTAEATAEERARALIVAWSGGDKTVVYRLLQERIVNAITAHAAAAVKRARAECAKAAAELNEWLQKRCNWYQTEIARKRACAEAAEADVARMQALVNREVTECERLRDEVAGLKTAAQPARQPAASGEARDYTADLRAALLALGFDWPADPRSPREVFRDELLPRIRVLVSNERHWWAKAKACETLHGARP